MTSLNGLGEEVLGNLGCSFEELENIWQYIGYESDDKTKRAKILSDRIQKTLVEVIQEENKFRIDLESRMDAMKREITEVCQALKLPPFFPPRGLSSYKLLQVLDAKVKELEEIKCERRSVYTSTYTQIVELCSRLDIKDTTPILQHFDPIILATSEQTEAEHQVNGETVAPIPTEEAIAKLNTKLTELQTTFKAIQTKYDAFRGDIVRIAADISYHPQDDFEASVLGEHLLSSSTSSPASSTGDGGMTSQPLMTQETLDQLGSWRLRMVKQKAMLVGRCEELRTYLEKMWGRLGVDVGHQKKLLEDNVGYKPQVLEALQTEVDRIQEMKWERMNDYLHNLRSETEALYSKCFLDRHSQDFPGLQEAFVDPPTDPEEAINALEREIDRLSEVYENGAPVFSIVATYQTLWRQYLEVEAKMKDPAILSNRGGIMLKTDKERKRLLKELPKVEQEVARALEASPSNANFRLYDRSFSDYVLWQWEEFRASQDSSGLPGSARASRRPSRPVLKEAGMSQSTILSPGGDSPNASSSANRRLTTSSRR